VSRQCHPLFCLQVCVAGGLVDPELRLECGLLALLTIVDKLCSIVFLSIFFLFERVLHSRHCALNEIILRKC